MKRHASDARPAAVLLIDLDHFKSINDRFGHAIGDRVLQVFADEAKSNLRACDMVGRLGGEEFAALLYDAARERALAAAERIRASFAQAAGDVDGRPVGATVSIGVAVNGNQPLDVPELLRQADQALYHTKERWVELASLDLVLPRKEGAANVRLAAKTAA
ncbi:MAG: GGDEF domain-containing protein [Xanthobacteraceae bacterium]